MSSELLQCVKKGDVKGATKLLASKNAPDPNFQDPETGNTALHLAVIGKNEVLVKLLIVFGADLELKNHQDKTAFELAKDFVMQKDPTAISEVISYILDFVHCLEQNLDDDSSKALRSTDRGEDEVLMLSLDGGGIHGLVLMQVCIEMEKRRKKLYPGLQPLLSQFNWVTGNSAGGISALALVVKNLTAEQGRKLFFRLKDEVLSGEPPIPNDQVDGVFKDVYGPSAVMSDIKDRHVSVMTTLCKASPPALHIMSNYGRKRHEGTEPPENQLIWKAARATSAVPVFFHPQDEIYLDGGLIANNPTTDAIIDMYEYKKEADLKVVLSLGCGVTKKEAVDDGDFPTSVIGTTLGQIENFFHHEKTGTEMDEIFTLAHNRHAFKNLLHVFLAQSTQPNGEVLKRGKFLCEKVGANYFRINPPIPDVNFLSTDDKELIDMLYDVKLYMLKKCRRQIDPVLDAVYGQ